MLKHTSKNHNKKNSKCILGCLNRTWWKSNSRITKATGTTIGIMKINYRRRGNRNFRTDPAGIEAVLAKLNQSLSNSK
jgi:hypothetical protein